MAAVQTRDIGEETLDLLRRLIALQSVNDLTPILAMKRLLQTYLKASSMGYPSKLNASSLTRGVQLWLSLCAAAILQRSP